MNHRTILPAAVRAHTIEQKSPARRASSEAAPWPDLVLIVDTETTIDRTQRLTFGSYQVWDGDDFVEEGLFGADELPAAQWAVLADYVAHHADANGHPLKLYRRRAFLAEVFWPLAWKARAGVVGFNLPFDLSRLAVRAARARKRYAGGFSLMLWEYQDPQGRWQPNPHRPRIAIKALDSKRALIGFTSAWRPDPAERIPEGDPSGRPRPGYRYGGRFLDLRAETFALTNASHSLASACRALGAEYGKDEDYTPTGEVTWDEIDYNRHDVRATRALYVRLQERYRPHPIALPPDQAYSPAAIGKSYLRALGVRLPEIAVAPHLKLSADEVTGLAMSAYYGGRAECRIRKTIVPVVYGDFLSMYPTDNTLMGLWGFLTAERVVVEAATSEVQAWLEAVTADDLFRPETWRQLPALVELQPDDDILPLRSTYDGSGATFQIGVNYVSSERPLWYTLADVVATKLLTSRAPRVRRALRFRPEGRQGALQPVALAGSIPIDPRETDFFRAVIEERQRVRRDGTRPPHERATIEQFLKVLANSASYGIFVELNRQENTPSQVEVFGVDRFVQRVNHVERPGAFYFPILGTLITGAARLMLALAEHEVAARGGTYAFMDTDSIAIVASEDGGLVSCPGGTERAADGSEAIRALSWAQVDQIIDRFRALNPYDPAAVPGSILKVEEQNFAPDPMGSGVLPGRRRQLYCLAVSAKRYALVNLGGDGNPVIRKPSDHGLGHLLPPLVREQSQRRSRPRANWTEQVWLWLVRQGLGLPAPEPEWLDQPCLTQLSIAAPSIADWFVLLNRRKPYGKRVNPFGFVLVAHVAPTGYPLGVDPERFVLVAPFTSDVRRWRQLGWVNRYDGKRHAVDAEHGARDPQAAGLYTFRAYLEAFRHHPEAKSAGRDGVGCGRDDMGLLQRRYTRVGSVVHLGKEANKLEQVEAGIIGDVDEVYNVYQDDWERVRLILQQMPMAELVRESGLSRRALHSLRTASSLPRAKNQGRLREIASQWSRVHRS